MSTFLNFEWNISNWEFLTFSDKRFALLSHSDVAFRSVFKSVSRVLIFLLT